MRLRDFYKGSARGIHLCGMTQGQVVLSYILAIVLTAIAIIVGAVS